MPQGRHLGHLQALHHRLGRALIALGILGSSKPAPAPPKWSSASTVPTFTTTTGTRRSSSSSPGTSRVTQTKDENPSLVTGTPERAGRFCRKGAKSEVKIRRKSITQTRTRQPDGCYASHCFFRVLLSVGTFCVNGRAHATARRRFLSHFPGDHEHAWARSRKTGPRPRSIRGRGSARQMPPSRGGRDGQAPRRRSHRPSRPSGCPRRPCTASR